MAALASASASPSALVIETDPGTACIETGPYATPPGDARRGRAAGREETSSRKAVATWPPDIAVAWVIMERDGHRLTRPRKPSCSGPVAGLRPPDVPRLRPRLRPPLFVVHVAAPLAPDTTVVADRAAPVGAAVPAPRAMRQVPSAAPVTEAPVLRRPPSRSTVAGSFSGAGSDPASGSRSVAWPPPAA